MIRAFFLMTLILFIGCRQSDTNLPLKESAGIAVAETPTLAARPDPGIYRELGFNSINVFDWTMTPPVIHCTDKNLSQTANEILNQVQAESGQVLLAIPRKSEKMKGRLVLRMKRKTGSDTPETYWDSRVLDFDFKPQYLGRCAFGNIITKEFMPQIDPQKEHCVGLEYRWGGSANPDWIFGITQVRQTQNVDALEAN